MLTHVSVQLGQIHIIDGDHHLARERFIDALSCARRGLNSIIPESLCGLAAAADQAGEHAMAATLHGAADQAADQRGQYLEAGSTSIRVRSQEHLRAVLGEAPFLSAYQQGRELTEPQAVAIGLESAQEPTAR